METTSENKSGQRLKALLKEAHCQQKELAQFLNYSQNHISLIVLGKRKLTAETARKIIAKYSPETRIEWLLGFDDFRTDTMKNEQIWMDMKSNANKNRKTPDMALVENGWVLCPRCGRRLARAYYGAEAKGLELWCSGKGCCIPVLVEL